MRCVFGFAEDISNMMRLCIGFVPPPLPSGRQHLIYDDCLEDKREDCQNRTNISY